MNDRNDCSIIRAEDLKKSFTVGARSFDAVRGVNLQLRRGEFLCLSGSSGSGKSTLLRLLAGLMPASSGRVLLQEHDFSRITDSRRTELRAQHMGIVFQRSNLFPALTVRDNLRLAARIAYGDWNAESERREKLLETLGIAQLVNHRPHQLSGGEQQRVAIARALVHQPKLLLADEPTGSLDSENTENILQVLEELNRTIHQTIFLITHDAYVARRGSRHLVMNDGRLS